MNSIWKRTTFNLPFDGTNPGLIKQITAGGLSKHYWAIISLPPLTDPTSIVINYAAETKGGRLEFTGAGVWIISFRLKQSAASIRLQEKYRSGYIDRLWACPQGMEEKTAQLMEHNF